MDTRITESQILMSHWYYNRPQSIISECRIIFSDIRLNRASL